MAIAATSFTKFYISGSGSTPAANTTAADVSDYAGLTYVEVSPIESIGEFGDSSAVITFAALGDSRVRKRKGVRDAGDLNVVCANDGLDNGQKAMIAAQLTSTTYAFKVLLEDSADSNDTDSIFYFRGLVASARLSVGGANEMIKRNFQVLIDSDVVEAPTAAVSGP